MEHTNSANGDRIKVPETNETRYRHITSGQKKLMAAQRWERIVRKQKEANRADYYMGSHVDNEFRICVLCGLVYGFREEDCAGVTPAMKAKAEMDDANYRTHEAENCWCLALKKGE